jgi:hypothetical protein
MTDMRRHGVIEVIRAGAGVYHLTINGVMWSEVEWSPAKQTWCVQDSCGHCLAHCEHTHGEEIDREAAIRLAKRMISNGTMPSPEEAEAALWARQQGAPFDMPHRTRDPVPR